MATELWASFVDKGMEKTEAGMAVRKAFGDYTNITTAERNMTKLFFFYPWTKTVLPFWVNALTNRPQWITAPMNALTTYSEMSAPGTPVNQLPTWAVPTNTNQQGQAQGLQTLPFPQKRVEDLLRVVAPRESQPGTTGVIDLAGGVPERIQPLMNMAQYHLTPGLGDVAAGLEQTFKPVQQPGVTPAANVVFNKDAPLDVQLQQIAMYALQNNVPFASLVTGAFQASKSLSQGQPLTAAQSLLGGFQYEQAGPGQYKAIGRDMMRYEQAIRKANQVPDLALRDSLKRQAYDTFVKSVNSVMHPEQATAQPQPQQPQAVGAP
jgi:hypothetical protein